MGSAITKLLKDDVSLKKIKTSAHEFALLNYSWSTRVNDYEKMYTFAFKKHQISG